MTTSSSTKSPPSDNKDLPSTKLSPRSYSRALKDDPDMSKEKRETRGMFKNLGRALHICKDVEEGMSLKEDFEEQPDKRTPSPPPRKKSLSPPQASSKSISSKSTHYTSLSSPKPQERSPLQTSPNNPHVSTMDNWPPGPSNPSLPPRVSQLPPRFPNPPPGFKPLPSTQPLFVNINNNTPHLLNNAHPLGNIYHSPPNLGNHDFSNPPNILDFVHPNDMPHLHNMFCQYCSMWYIVGSHDLHTCGCAEIL
ncbi:hypothetical protein Tco_0027001 [Tanacetum coccineum]